jgi:hypothetical protein
MARPYKSKALAVVAGVLARRGIVTRLAAGPFR